MRSFLALALFLTAAGCASDPADVPPEAAPPTSETPPTDPAPAPEAPSESLSGTWAHVATADTPDGPRDPLSTATISWTFRPDGTGTYSQQVLSGRTRTNDFEWTLDGETLDLGAATYAIVSRDGDEMVWRNDRLGDYYIVQRQ
ncbi:hypothetical protein [Rubrivirga marina]|uniref:Lipocalin-like domain-containing protein n=1 Tax=Rubrivirga marina TaxID=1196024 RepID=A0A271J4P5_9BACT|nr:hypothetical protein [Rubrivirga marina]PAP78501.1 hypothetical protein BSZ37_19765 [Rubrivirga marina]